MVSEPSRSGAQAGEGKLNKRERGKRGERGRASSKKERLTRKESVELVDPSRSRKVNRLVPKVNKESSKNARVDLVLDLELLSLGLLRRLERLLDSGQRGGLERLGRGDGDREETRVGLGKGEEVGEDRGGEGESGVLGEDGEEVGGDL